MSTMTQSTSTAPVSNASADGKPTTSMPEGPQQAVQGIPDIVIVVDDRQRHRSG